MESVTIPQRYTVCVAFDVLALDGRNVRAAAAAVTEGATSPRRAARQPVRALRRAHRRRRLRAIRRRVRPRLEGVVAKDARASYPEPTTWIKVKNHDYTGARATGTS